MTGSGRDAAPVKRDRRWRQGTAKPRNTQVTPAVNPNPGSRDVIPRMMPASSLYGAPGEPSADPHRGPAVGAWRRVFRVGWRIAAVDLSDDLDALAHGAGDRQAIGHDVTLLIPACRIAQHAETDVTDHAHRLDGLADQRGDEKVGRVESQAALVAGIGQAGGEPNPDRRPARGFRHEPHLGRQHEVFDIRGLVAGEVEQIRQRRALASGDVQPIVETAVDLDLRDGAEPEAGAERRQPQQIALQPGDRVEEVTLNVETTFEEDESGPDCFGVFCQEWPLLGRGRRRAAEAARRQEHRYEPSLDQYTLLMSRRASLPAASALARSSRGLERLP